MDNENNSTHEDIQEQDPIAKLASSWAALSKSERREKFDEKGANVKAKKNKGMMKASNY